LQALLSSRGRCGRPGGLVAVVAAFVLAVSLWAGGASTAAGSRLTLATLEQQAIEQINALRVSYGLHPLRFSPALYESAETHCQQMLAGGYFGHSSPTGAPFSSRIESFYRVAHATDWAAGENLFWSSGPATSSQMIAEWMQSPGHRRNLLNPAWRQIGLATVTSPSAPGVYEGLGVTVVTADFGFRA
jgi:uncharacterized protein YkwD